ncbi:hypothetical protein IFM89_035819 [Coptis chinensis]|uniref:Brf1 TBP-binding domain-containing protein n=1 Tax=Coptis chinensis TaxID=261450 RepID=A0A835I761_9MAGN|nr:hypothetical protein IFM89_035819 [Coptis chinensis]
MVMFQVLLMNTILLRMVFVVKQLDFGHEDIDNTGDESESFSDIDDVESGGWDVSDPSPSGYLYDEEEKRLKTKIWESLNWEYLEEEAAKEAEAKFGNWSEGSINAKQLAAATEAALANSKK